MVYKRKVVMSKAMNSFNKKEKKIKIKQYGFEKIKTRWKHRKILCKNMRKVDCRITLGKIARTYNFLII